MKISDEETAAAVDRLLWKALEARNSMEFLAYRLGNLLPELDAQFCRDVVHGRVSFRPLVPVSVIKEPSDLD